MGEQMSFLVFHPIYIKSFTWSLLFFIIYCDICWEYIVRKHQHATYILLKEARVLSKKIGPFKENIVQTLTALVNSHFLLFIEMAISGEIFCLFNICFIFNIFLYFLEHINLNAFIIIVS